MLGLIFILEPSFVQFFRRKKRFQEQSFSVQSGKSFLFGTEQISKSVQFCTSMNRLIKVFFSCRNESSYQFPSYQPAYPSGYTQMHTPQYNGSYSISYTTPSPYDRFIYNNNNTIIIIIIIMIIRIIIIIIILIIIIIIISILLIIIIAINIIKNKLQIIISSVQLSNCFCSPLCYQSICEDQRGGSTQCRAEPSDP